MELLMALVLYRLGRLGFRRRGLVVAIWLVVLTGLGGAVAVLGTAPTSTISIPGTESQTALDALAEEFPQASGASGTVAVRAPEGQSVLDEQNQAVVQGLAEGAAAIPGVVGVVEPVRRPGHQPRRALRVGDGPVRRGRGRPRRGPAGGVRAPRRGCTRRLGGRRGRRAAADRARDRLDRGTGRGGGSRRPRGHLRLPGGRGHDDAHRADRRRARPHRASCWSAMSSTCRAPRRSWR